MRGWSLGIIGVSVPLGTACGWFIPFLKPSLITLCLRLILQTFLMEIACSPCVILRARCIASYETHMNVHFTGNACVMITLEVPFSCLENLSSLKALSTSFRQTSLLAMVSVCTSRIHLWSQDWLQLSSACYVQWQSHYRCCVVYEIAFPWKAVSYKLTSNTCLPSTISSSLFYSLA